MQNYPKKIKRLLREYMIKAYEHELHRELAKLDRGFSEWRKGTIDNGELSDRLHQFEVGPARELYKKYNYTPHDMTVAYAIVTGMLNRDEIPAELQEAISSWLAYYQSLKDDDKLKEPGE